MKVTRKITHLIFRGAAVAVVTRVGLVILRKVNGNVHLEEKANHMIDKNAEKAKKIAKVGVAKTLQMSEVAQDKLEMTDN